MPAPVQFHVPRRAHGGCRPPAPALPGRLVCSDRCLGASVARQSNQRRRTRASDARRVHVFDAEKHRQLLGSRRCSHFWGFVIVGWSVHRADGDSAEPAHVSAGERGSPTVQHRRPEFFSVNGASAGLPCRRAGMNGDSRTPQAPLPPFRHRAIHPRAQRECGGRVRAG